MVKYLIFNGDDHTDFMKQAAGFAIMEEVSKEEEKDVLNFDYDSDGLNL